MLKRPILDTISFILFTVLISLVTGIFLIQILAEPVLQIQDKFFDDIGIENNEIRFYLEINLKNKEFKNIEELNIILEEYVDSEEYNYIIVSLFNNVRVGKINDLKNIYKKWSFYCLVILIIAYYIFSRRIYKSSREMDYFKDKENMQVYMRSQCLPDMANAIKKKIKSGEVNEVKEIYEEFKGLIKWED